MSEFSIDCECGAALPVSASQAGATIDCRCGRELKAPLLSQLRQRQGKGAYEAGAIDAIKRLIAEGKLPSSDVCAVSGRPTKDVCRFDVQCERMWYKSVSTNRYLFVLVNIFLLAIYPVAGLIHLFVNSRNSNAHDQDLVMQGRDRGVDVVLRIDAEFHGKVRRYSQSALKTLLRSEPSYAELLDEYPNATIRVSY